MPHQLDFGIIVLDPAEHRRQQKANPRCLSCQQRFPSTGPGNRICRACKGRDVWMSPGIDHVAHAAF